MLIIVASVALVVLFGIILCAELDKQLKTGIKLIKEQEEIAKIYANHYKQLHKDYIESQKELIALINKQKAAKKNLKVNGQIIRAIELLEEEKVDAINSFNYERAVAINNEIKHLKENLVKEI